MATLDEQIDEFLQAPAFAVIGASDDRSKYGHKVYSCYLQNGHKAYPINPNAKTVMGNPAYAKLADLPEKVQSVSIITPPAVTERVVKEAIALGVKSVWMQPGAESPAAIQEATAHGLHCIAGGPCLLVVMGYRET